MDVASEALERGIDQARAGHRIYDISSAIQRHAEEEKFSVVRDYVGHGIGKNLHEDPQVPNFGKAGSGPRLKEGMVLAIEPMVNQGTWKVELQKDGWGVVTADGQLSAHFEHTVAIGESGPEVLTRWS
jgi:methionyl aminopeptidase